VEDENGTFSYAKHEFRRRLRGKDTSTNHIVGENNNIARLPNAHVKGAETSKQQQEQPDDDTGTSTGTGFPDLGYYPEEEQIEEKKRDFSKSSEDAALALMRKMDALNGAIIVTVYN